MRNSVDHYDVDDVEDDYAGNQRRRVVSSSRRSSSCRLVVVRRFEIIKVEDVEVS